MFELTMCPLTKKTMEDPVFASDGFVYDRIAIEVWMMTHACSPLTNLPFVSTELTPATVFQLMILALPERKVLVVPKRYLRFVVGVGGNVVRNIERNTGACVRVDRARHVGIVTVFGGDVEAAEREVEGCIKRAREAQGLGATRY